MLSEGLENTDGELVEFLVKFLDIGLVFKESDLNRIHGQFRLTKDLPMESEGPRKCPLI